MGILISTGTGMEFFFREIRERLTKIGEWLPKYAVLEFDDFSYECHYEADKIRETIDGYLCKWCKYSNGYVQKWIGIRKENDDLVIDGNGVDFLFVNYPFPNLFDDKSGLSTKNIRFGEIVGGSFICSHSQLSSMTGFPEMVGRVFDISYSQIRDLNHAPNLVDRDFVCHGCGFTKEQIVSQTRVTQGVYC